MPKTINNGWLATDPPLILVFFSVNSYSLKYFSMGNTHSEGYCWRTNRWTSSEISQHTVMRQSVQNAQFCWVCSSFLWVASSSAPQYRLQQLFPTMKVSGL